MGRSIEYKVRLKAAIICMIVAACLVATIVYLKDLRREISLKHAEIANQRTLLSSVNELIFRVSEAQSFSNLYLSQKGRKQFRAYTHSLDSVEMLIDTLIALWPDDTEKLHRIGSLLRDQARNITTLNRQFAVQNPVEEISQRIERYEPETQLDTIHIVNIRHDTVISEVPRKGFFKRLKAVFKPDRELVKITVNQQMDTIRMFVPDSLAIMQEVGDMAQKARGVYDRNIRTIEKRVNSLVSNDKDIASEISSLLLELHENTLDSTLRAIAESEWVLDRNYTYSIIGGGVALALILTFIILIITDINKGARARRAVEQANERIRQVMESRHRLLLSVSHDIKTPLNSIQGYLGLLEETPYIQSMRNSSEHILSLLENLLEFSSIEQGTLRRSDSDFNLRVLCAEIFDMFLPLAQQKLLAFSYNADNLRIRTDRTKLKQIIINLVSNGVKYTVRGGVEFSAYFEGERLRIEVRDTGAGISAESLPLLFKPFSRVERNSALAEGTGFGLFVVKGLVELLGGKIEVRSEVAAGTTMYVDVPTVRVSREIPKGTKRIRIHDDDPVIVLMLSEMLAGLGHRVAEDDCDLIITDLEMGETSGLDVLRSAGETPVVIMTGRADFTTGQAAAMGFDGFLAKPFSIDTLREVVGDGECPDDLLGADREEILALFRASANENFDLLRQALTAGDFHRAQAVCHKMFPMFAQLGYPVEALRRMDVHRNKPYDEWQDDVKQILSIKV